MASRARAATAPSAIVDIKPHTPIARFDRSSFGPEGTHDPGLVAPVVGMSLTFIRKVVGHRGLLSGDDVLALVDQDAFHETFVPRSKIQLEIEPRKRIRRTAEPIPWAADNIGDSGLLRIDLTGSMSCLGSEGPVELSDPGLQGLHAHVHGSIPVHGQGPFP